ncbi:MAG: NAD-dependent epimerase/dehydratase family protein [Candidatus Levybacteria bacterium]|nr:NAD-dependent epimerase/dehydratase family protein [Candidatus Levybacteria bacterium]
MKYKKILVTGGAGFVGSNICIKLKQEFPQIQITAFDNLIRKGSELNLPRFKKQGIGFIRGDVRNRADLALSDIDLIIECSAEPSVMAGVTSSPEYLVDTNLIGALNCFELARKTKADVVFLSTSRVYPVKHLNNLSFKEDKTRFSLVSDQSIRGSSEEGITEDFPLDGVRTLYGATKLSAEFMLTEYINNYGIKGIINRCGLITGPWQMGKVDQGVIVLWMAKHVYKKPLSYIGFGGEGKQVRDIIDIDDLFDLLKIQLEDIEKYSGEIFNVGGGRKNSLSLLELTNLCRNISGNEIKIEKVKEDRAGDVRIYIGDNSKITKLSGWSPKKSTKKTLEEIYKWIIGNKDNLEPILS